MIEEDVFLPDPQAQKRYGVTPMTFWRWDNDPKLGFPGPYIISGRKYRKLSELREFEARFAGASARAPPPTGRRREPALPWPPTSKPPAPVTRRAGAELSLDTQITI